MAKKATSKKKKSTKKPIKTNLGWFQVGKMWFNLDQFVGISEEEAIERSPLIDKGRIKNVWKHANGKR